MYYQHDLCTMNLMDFIAQQNPQINLSYTSVSDVGLLSLASISCLQSMTVLHVRGLTPRGLAAALLACGGLTKVKLHASFKSSLPKLLVKHLEARGCTFQWRDKLFQVTMACTYVVCRGLWKMLVPSLK